MDHLDMDSQQTFSLLLEKLQFKTSSNLILRETLNDNVPAELEMAWQEGRDKLQVDAMYFIANTPIIYFKQFEAYRRETIAEFHRKVWNQSKVPLIFVILPNDIRIYSGYEAPKQRGVNDLSEPSRLDNIFEYSDNLWERLEIFTRVAIESG